MNRTYTIDAAGRALGRVATEVATLLAGKDKADYTRHEVAPVKVTVINAKQLKLTGNKLKDKYYKHYTGYPGGMRYETVERVTDKKGYSEIIRHAVHGMLPDNKLKPLMMKNLTINE